MSKQRKKHLWVVLREQEYRQGRRKAMSTRLHHKPRVRALQKVKGFNPKICRKIYSLLMGNGDEK